MNYLNMDQIRCQMSKNNNKTSTIKPFYIGEGGVRRSEKINSAESERNTKKYYCTALHY